MILTRKNNGGSCNKQTVAAFKACAFADLQDFRSICLLAAAFDLFYSRDEVLNGLYLPFIKAKI